VTEPALSPATVAVTAGRPPRIQGGPVNPPLVLTSTYVSQGPPAPGELFYTRNDTETWRALESALAALEGAALPALAFASGMAAIAAAFSLVPRGGRVVMPQHAYGVSLGLAHELAALGDIRLTLVDIADTDAVTAALAGAGVVRAPAWQVAAHIDAGRLQPVLDRFAPPATPVHVLFEQTKLASPKIRTFVDYLVDQWGHV